MEASVARGAPAGPVQAMVPPQYQPVTANGPGLIAVSIRVWDYTCDSVSVDGQQRSRRSSVTLVGVRLVDGGYYLLAVGTDDAVLAARMRQGGLPVSRTSVVQSLTTSLGSTTAAWQVAGGLAHRLEVTAPLPVPEPSGSSLRLYRIDPRGEQVVLTYRNELVGQVDRTPAGFDLSGLDGVGALFFLPVDTATNGTLATGSWSSSLAVG